MMIKNSAVSTVLATDGTEVPVDSLEQTLTRNGSGFVDTISVVFEGRTYIQTFTRSLDKVVKVSRWVKQ